MNYEPRSEERAYLALHIDGENDGIQLKPPAQREEPYLGGYMVGLKAAIAASPRTFSPRFSDTPTTEAFNHGRAGMKPQHFDLAYLLAWAEGFAFLVQEREQTGWVPSMEWKPRSAVVALHCEATSYDDCPF